MMYGWGAGSGAWGVGWMILSMALFWGILLAVLFLLVRSNDRRKGGDEPSAVDVLRRRFANGEIQKEEFEERMRTLRDLRV